MKFRFLFISLAFTSILITTGCISFTAADRYEITIFLEEAPSRELQENINQTLEENRMDNLTLNWNTEEPSHIEAFPTIVVQGPDQTFETTEMEEFEEHIEAVR